MPPSPSHCLDTHKELEEFEDALVCEDVQRVASQGVDHRQPVDFILYQRRDSIVQTEAGRERERENELQITDENSRLRIRQKHILSCLQMSPHTHNSKHSFTFNSSIILGIYCIHSCIPIKKYIYCKIFLT